MQRSRSPMRFRRERSPSIVSIHSRDPSVRERSFSISSLSSCSLGQSFKPTRNLTQNSAQTNRNNQTLDEDLDSGEILDIGQVESQDLDERRLRRHRKREKRRRKKENEYERSTHEDNRNIGRNNNRVRPDQPNHREKEIPHLNYPSSSHRQNNVDLLDPSVTLQEQTVYNLQSILDFDQRNSNKLDRLEKLLEAVLLTKTRQQSSSEFVPENSDNPFEFNPRNTAFTTSMWLSKINEDCIEKNYDEKNCIQYMQSKMTGLMKAWFKTLDIFEYSWPELKMLIIRTFPDNAEFSATLRLLVDRFKRPEETITQYYFSKMYLLEACKIIGSNAVSCLIDGLADPYLQQEAKRCNFLTPETLYSQFFSKLPNFGIQQPQMGAENMSKNIDEYMEYSGAGTQVSGHSTMAEIAVRNSAKKCFTCKKKGHIAADCRHAPVCYRCNKEGHIAAKCRN